MSLLAAEPSKPRTLKVMGVRVQGAEQERTNPLTGQRFFLRYMTVNLDLAHRPRGWDIEILNAGTQECNGDIDATNEVITDNNGYTLDHLTPLDDQGMAITDGSNEWYTRWRLCCADLHDMPVLRDYVTNP